MPALGATWSGTEPLNSNANVDSGRDILPFLAVASNGVAVCAWSSVDTLQGTIGTDDDILFSRSDDFGVTWSLVAPLDQEAAFDGAASNIGFGMCTDGQGTWITTWRSDYDRGGILGTDDDIFCAVSIDDGLSWQQSIVVNNDATVDHFFSGSSDSNPSIACDQAGTWMIAWQMQKNGPLGTADTDIVFATSTDGGQSWLPAKHVKADGATDSVSDQHPKLISLGPSSWLASWISVNSLVTSQSNDNGLNWTVPLPVADAELGPGRPFDIATDGNGHLVVVWSDRSSSSDDYDIYCATSVNGGAAWSDRALLNAYGDSDSLFDHDSAPTVAYGGGSTWFAAWSTNYDLSTCGVPGTGTDGDLLYAVSQDNGLTWSTPLPVGNRATIDDGADEFVRIAATETFHWLAVWQTTDTLDGLLDDDVDIVFVNTTIPDADGDHIYDGIDNCPGVANEDQTDADLDGYGDACDACPHSPPGSIVDHSGRPRGDEDADCDVDLGDFAIIQANMMGPSGPESRMQAR